MADDPRTTARKLMPGILKIWPDIELGDFARAQELMGQMSKQDYRREDILLTLDQAYSERCGTPRRLNPNWFTLTGMLHDLTSKNG